ncbi:hypothetical protein HZ326_0497 [Fusarium oxysporum f. sp. albedinis]|nr:hypothetical protein HZ326_0497 [Fusarium oxysporum f. sp. albedinis]
MGIDSSAGFTIVQHVASLTQLKGIASPSILMAMTLRALPVRMYIISFFFRITSVFNCIWDYQHIYLDLYREGAQHL